ncbi:metalloprotease [Cladophialophora chaetospira]|uniref:Metalloprotease n=1 Tax=Cladophialophora chaetospira TaxID=386627 RepID=A0AA39CD97_9EURO|nr:metalloprotease [Cladophialophora chaetospira]
MSHCWGTRRFVKHKYRHEAKWAASYDESNDESDPDLSVSNPVPNWQLLPRRTTGDPEENASPSWVVKLVSPTTKPVPPSIPSDPQFRRFVVAYRSHEICCVISINTYAGRGLKKFGLSEKNREAHAIICMNGANFDPSLPKERLDEKGERNAEASAHHRERGKKKEAARKLAVDLQYDSWQLTQEFRVEADCNLAASTAESQACSVATSVTIETRRQFRRGRGRRKNDAYWSDATNANAKDLFDDRDCLFPDADGRLVMPALANLDTQLKVTNGLVMSSRYAKEIGRYDDISKDFVDPCLQSISGHITPVIGILRNMPFRLKGTSVTFHRDFWICDAIDSVVDVMVGASFIAENFKLLFDKFQSLCSTFAGWFSTRKETPEEKAERERLETKQRLETIKREQARLARERAILEAGQPKSQ